MKTDVRTIFIAAIIVLFLGLMAWTGAHGTGFLNRHEIRELHNQ